MVLLCAALALVSPAPLSAQAASDVYLLSLARDGSTLRLGAPVNMSASAGYDNQPSFTPDAAAVLFTSVREGGQSDIYRYNIAAKNLARLTGAPESEYSALVTPDGAHFSTIRVEVDSVQRLWKFPLAGGAPTVVLEQLRPVGYHTWVSDTLLALFVLGSPNTLQIASTRTGASRVVANNIGRSLHTIPGTKLVSFVDKSADPWQVSSMNPETGAKVPLVATQGRSEDLAWLDANTILCSNGTQLLISRRLGGAFQSWEVAAELAPLGLSGVSRLAVSGNGNWLALVAAEGRAP
jgi:Tol biopolymer transport system component